MHGGVFARARRRNANDLERVNNSTNLILDGTKTIFYESVAVNETDTNPLLRSSKKKRNKPAARNSDNARAFLNDPLPDLVADKDTCTDGALARPRLGRLFRFAI